MREVEMNRANSGIDAVTEVSRIVKSSCLDPLSSMEMSAYGFTPGASAMVTKLASAACQRLTRELSQKVNDINGQISQGVSNAKERAGLGPIDSLDPNQMTEQLANQIRNQNSGMGNVDTNMGPGQSSQGITERVGDAVVSVWDKMKNLLTP